MAPEGKSRPVSHYFPRKTSGYQDENVSNNIQQENNFFNSHSKPNSQKHNKLPKSATRRGGRPQDGKKGVLPPKFPKIEEQYQKKLHNLILKNQNSSENQDSDNKDDQIDYKPLYTEGAVLPKGLDIQNK